MSAIESELYDFAYKIGYYYEGRCMSLKNITQYSCEGKFELNKLACLNNNKDKQHCIWNAKATKCESLEINS